MSTQSRTPASSKPSGNSVASCSQFTHEQLADIYNQARIDYIVPMPMNGKRMAEYIHYYDIDLDGSFVSFNDDQLETGIGMLGVRDKRSWITRLGVLPHRRGSRIGQFLMETMIDYSVAHDFHRIQLEVIVGNDPAHRLFTKLGFEEVRELLIIRRPPGPIHDNPEFEQVTISEIDETQLPDYLAQRTDTPSWIDENESLLNAGSLQGFMAEMPDGESNWVIFQKTPFQLTRLVFGDFTSEHLMRSLLYHVHKQYPMQDTKVENVPVESQEWRVYQQMGYFEVFRRTEMYLHLK